MAITATQIEIEGRCITIDRPGKMLWPRDRLSVMDLAQYYVAVSPWLLPHIKRRPIVYETYSGTIDGPSTFEQDPPENAPRWVKRTCIAGRERTVTYVLCENAAALVYLVSLHAVTLHIWESTTAAIEKPDFLLFDLDPVGTARASRIARVALELKARLESLGLKPLAKTSGARGMHVVAPILPDYEFRAVRAFERAFCKAVADGLARETTLERQISKRPDGTVYLDWGQMGRGMTVAAPLTVRPCDGAPVAMPLDWDEVEAFARSRSRRRPNEIFARYSMKNAVERLQSTGDPWAQAWQARRLAVSPHS